MNRLERINNLSETLLQSNLAHQSQLWTALPGIIQSFNPVQKTCVVRPAIQAKFTTKDGISSWVTLPLLLDCPVQFPSGGGYTLTFPLTYGDECLVVFSSRCIDAWWQHGKVQNQPVMRMHDLSDGFVLPGISSVPNVQPNISTNSVQLRSNVGSTYVELAGSNVNIIAPGTVTATAPSIVLNGNVTINGTITQTGGGTTTLSGQVVATGAVSGAGIGLTTHHHGGVQTGAGNTGGALA